MDRIIAMYQHRYPDTWVEDSSQPKATYTLPKDSIQGAASPLAPFHMNAKGDMWTSTTSRNWTSFGYTYPELVGNPSNDTLTIRINELYKAPNQGLNNNNTISALGITNNSADALDWMAEVKMPSDIQISYSVRAFLGPPDADPKNWATDPNYVGQIASLSSPRMNSDVVFTATIGLTAALAQRYQAGDLPSLEKSDVAAWLDKNFHWRIQALDFSEIPRSSPPPGLEVTLFSVPVHLPHEDTQVPTWTGAFAYEPQIKGNPPSYDKPSLLDQGGGKWNATAGQWTWNSTAATNSTKSHGVASASTVRISQAIATQTLSTVVLSFETVTA